MKLLHVSYFLLLALAITSSVVAIPVSVNLILSSFLIIHIGAHRSLAAETPALTKEETWMFPIMGSCVLFSLYLAFKFLGKYYVNLLMGLYFTALGVVVLAQTLSEIITVVIPSKKHVVSVDFKMPCQSFSKRFLVAEVKFNLTPADVVAYILSLGLSVWHFTTKHFLANNLFGIAFSIQGLEHVALGTYTNGAILLVGLFFYDVFWVFGTDVMVTVAKSFDAPIKLLFLRAHATEDTDAQFSMLGLGDIVIPGIFIALLLRFDASKFVASGGEKPKPASEFSKTYFNCCIVGYVLGLATTLYVMYTFQAAQPALLYLSPACLLFSFIPALVKGDLKALLAYKDEEAEGEEEADGDNKKNDGETDSDGDKTAAATDADGVRRRVAQKPSED